MVQQPLYEPNEKRLDNMLKAFEQKDPPGYKGEAVREYQKELGRQIIARGTKNTIDNRAAHQHTDQDIAVRLMAAGHSKEKTSQAIAKASPEAGTLKTAKQQQLYGEKVVVSVLEQEKCKEVIGNTRRAQIQKGQEQERRLAKQNLATNCSRKPDPKPEPGSGRR